MTTDIRPFRIEIPQSQLDDLRLRLAATRWPRPVVEDFSHGQALSLVRELADYWRDGFDWRAQEARLNQLPQFMTEIDGQPVHFIHVKSPEPDAFPLILTHGWPSTPAEYLDLIGPLTNPRAHGRDGAPAFDVVIPSVPGMGLSSPLASAGWDAARIAAAWDTLMKRLGYSRYGAQGGDGGALVSRELGILAPEGLVGVHVQQVFAFPTGAPGEMEGLTPFEMAGFERLDYFRKYAGYVDIQSKRPGTLAYGLVDSPAALLSWNAELFFGFEGERVAEVDRDRFLTHVSLYWFTGTGGQAAEMYFANVATGAGYRDLPNPTPTAVAVFPDDFRSVRKFVERSHSRLVQWTEMPRGGHFANESDPGLVVDDLRRFFGALRAREAVDGRIDR
ncbi:epoxide hydrolase [Mitsuaria sp. GD03876]|uniref:epoxide hydrolase family protein n=1 Tax=Mitsuaria sp. GD03876 TaxID=2975399 RepID=UPI0024489F00|nr:epoxide hydrolase [Mitsuaria sp. GD03876]MDH0865944.1 epoxide hydrolase [Mitsuaria sp. GD03876]